MKYFPLRFLSFIACIAIISQGCDGTSAGPEAPKFAGRASAAAVVPGTITINSQSREFNSCRYRFNYTLTLMEGGGVRPFAIKVYYQTTEGDPTTWTYIKDLPFPPGSGIEDFFYLDALELSRLPSTSNGDIKIVLEAVIGANQPTFRPAATSVIHRKMQFYTERTGVHIQYDQGLLPGEFVIFPKMWYGSQVAAHDYKLIMQGDGNLLVYDENGVSYGRSGVHGLRGLSLHLISTGELFLVNPDATINRRLGDGGRYGADLKFQADGNLVLYKGNRTVAWYIGL